MAEQSERAKLNRSSVQHLREGNWGLYRNDKLRLADLSRKESHLEDALRLFCEVAYLDANGPSNTGGRSDFPSFDLKFGAVIPYIIERIENIRGKLGCDLDQVKGVFMDATQDYRRMRMPVTPDSAWKQVAQALGRMAK